MPHIAYRTATEGDIPRLTEVMTRAFDDDSRRYLGVERGGPPGYDNGDFFRQWLFGSFPTEGHVISSGGTIIGGIIVWSLPGRTFRLGNLFVDPEYQNQGVGTEAMKYMEATYPQARSWILDTPVWSIRNHRFYEKCGFVRMHQEGDMVAFGKETPAGAMEGSAEG